MEYHEAVMRGFDQKIAALIDEIESLRRDGRGGGRRSQIEPTPTTPSNDEYRRQQNHPDSTDDDDDGNHRNDENVFPPSPFSPNLAPLNALLDKLSALQKETTRPSVDL